MGQGCDRGGFSLVEITIAISVIAIALVSALYAVFGPGAQGDPALHVRVDLQLDAVRVLRGVTESLKSSGPIDLNADGVFDAGDYPYIGTDGISNASAYGGAYAILDAANPGIVPRAASESEGLGASQEIAFRKPRENGADGVSTDLFAIVLVPGTEGNELQLRRYDASGAIVHRRLLGRHVERITFETAASEPKPVLAPKQPLGAHQFRVTAWLRRVVDKKVYAVRQTGIVTMRGTATGWALR